MKKRKASLSATLVLLIVIITIATYVTKWVFDRYTIATRFYRSSTTTVQNEGAMLNRISCCRYGVGCQTTVGGKTVNVSINCSASNATQATFTINED
jgi:uncharacterized membrane protein